MGEQTWENAREAQKKADWNAIFDNEWANYCPDCQTEFTQE
jgi:hypothetical protein